MSKLVMGYWDCPVCGSKEIRGDVMNCPSCGRARGEVKFYVKGYTEGELLKEEELEQKEHLTEEEEKTFSKNPDWYCSFCNSLNSDNADTCGNCGASRADSEANYFEMLKKKEERDAAEAAAQPQVRTAEPKRSRLPMVILAVAVLVGLFFLIKGFIGGSASCKVTSLSWVRNVSIEENRKYSESDWTLPAGAEQTAARQELHHYDPVLDHYEDVPVQKSRQVLDHYEYSLEDNGNGTFSTVSHPVYKTEYYTVTEQRPVYRQVPRYQTKYYYDIWRWMPSRDVTASGDDHNAAWPEITLGENEREGQKSEVYRVTVTDQKDGGKVTTYRVAESAWQKINVGDSLEITTKLLSTPYFTDADGNKVELYPEN